MARIEHEEHLSAPAARQEIVQSLPSRSPRTRGGCCMVMAIVCVAIVLAGAWLVAMTGFVRVPLLSSLAFRGVEPLHVVQAGVSAEVVAQTTVTSTITDRWRSAGGVLQDRSIEIPIPETALTSSFQSALTSVDVRAVDVSRAQVAVLSGGGVEVFLPLVSAPTAVRVVLDTTAHNHVLDLSVRSVKIGSLSLPPAVASRVFAHAAGDALTELNRVLGSYMTIEEVSFRDGVMVLRGVLTVEVTPSSL